MTTPPVSPAERWEGALCTQVGMPDLWFPEPGANLTTAKRVCASCPLIQECLEYAMETEAQLTGYRFGIYGGLSAVERARLAREAAA